MTAFPTPLYIRGMDYYLKRAYSSTEIRAYLDNPALWQLFWNNVPKGEKQGPPQTPAMLFGQLFHKAVLEPENFLETYFMKIAKKERTVLQKMIDKAQKNKLLQAILKKSKKEVAIDFKYEVEGVKKVKCKAMIDIIHPQYTIDIKTIPHLTEYKVKKAVNDYRLDIQMAFYSYARGELEKGPYDKKELLLFCEKNEPYEQILFSLSPQLIERGYSGDDKFRGWFDVLKEMVTKPKKTKWDIVNPIVFD